MDEFIAWMVFAGATAWRRQQWIGWKTWQAKDRQEKAQQLSANSADYWAFWQQVGCPKMLDYRFRA